MATVMYGECDKSCSQGTIVMLFFVLCCILLAQSCSQNFQTIFLILAIVLMITAIVNYNGGYRQYMQPVEDLSVIDELKRVIRSTGVIPDKYLDIPVVSSKESYTFQKRKIFLCLKDFDTGKMFDFNTLMHVYVHELAHAMTPPEPNAHSDRWRQTFEGLLHRLAKAGVYDESKPFPSGAYMKACPSTGN